QEDRRGQPHSQARGPDRSRATERGISERSAHESGIRDQLERSKGLVRAQPLRETFIPKRAEHVFRSLGQNAWSFQMDKAALVDVDITSGKKILDILDKAGFKVIVAFWLYTSEFEAWRLYIAS